LVLIPLATMVLVAGALYFARDILIPLALAVMLSFVLTPPVLKLRAWGVPRSAAVMLVVTVTFALVLGIAVLLARQVTELAETLPRYELTLREKLRSLRLDPQAAGVIQRATEAVEALGSEIKGQPKPETGASATASQPAEASPRPIPVEVHQPPARPLDYVRDFLTPLLHPLATAGLVVVFVVLILLQREDLRDRMIRLAGTHDLERTTAAINDAAYRLSRLFLTYTIMNSAYGVFIAGALWLIGVPTAALWGMLAALMRFVPYVGSFIAAGFPVLVAAAVHPGWSVALLALALFIISEAAMGQFLEPWLLGRATGLSPLATIVALSFWAWLWGPVGLVLAIPLTVCLIVLGRHVEQLQFVDVLLGDEPALTPVQNFYQRLLAGDSAELVFSAEKCLKEMSVLDYLDTVAMPALLLAEADHRRGRFGRERLAEMESVIGELTEELSEAGEAEGEPEGEGAAREAESAVSGSEAPAPDLQALAPEQLRPEWRGAAPVLCIGLRDALDRAAAEMLALAARRRGIGCRVAGEEDATLTGLGQLDLAPVQVVVLSHLGGARAPAYARYFGRRLRRRKPQLKLIFAFWEASEHKLESDAGGVPEGAPATTLRDALDALVDMAKLPEDSTKKVVALAT
jgi:predicted PurR-regulated permease PerM/nitroreductase